MLNRSRLYVGDLPPHATEAGLREIFAAVGDVESIQLAVSSNTGASRGFAFVEMRTAEAMSQAIKQFNGYVWDGYMLMVYSVPPRSARRGESHAELR